MIRKTKIICTLGPSCDSEEMMEALILNGMNAARFNFSHGTHESHLATLTRLKHVRDNLGYPVATILDTKGPEIRTKTFETGSVELEAGQTFCLTVDEIIGNKDRVSVTYTKLNEELEPGSRILIDDGLIELLVTEIRGSDIVCNVIAGGPLSNNKSINIPDTHIHLPALTQRDKEDLRFAVENDFDFVAASFVRQASDIEEIRAVLDYHGGQHIGIIAKIENREGVDNMDSIADAADGVMVARGDLGVEIPAYEVPVLQKKIIKSCIKRGKPVITATQMLDSMMRNPRPTRAEVSDVANAVFDGTSCVMLSGETASGKYPIVALKTMSQIVVEAEKNIDYWKRFSKSSFDHSTITDAISHTSCLTAKDLSATAIIIPTQTGYTARMVSRFRPKCVIVSLSTDETVRRRMSITWGVVPCLCGMVDSTDRLFSLCVQSAKNEGLVQTDDIVVIAAGVPIGKTGSTNLIKAQVVK